MRPPSLTGSEKEVMDMTIIRSAQCYIVHVKAMLSLQNDDTWRLWAERKAFVKIINEYRKELGYESLARANVDSFSEPADISLDYLPRDTSNLSETCRNYLLLRDSILKDT